MFRFVRVAALIAALFSMPVAAQGDDTQDMSPEMIAWLDELSPQSGKVDIPAARAVLDLGEDYTFYSQDDARRILVDAWGNPPDATEGVLGLVMPKGTTPFSDSWGAVITFDDVGYVSDDDAADVDYDDLLEQLQDDSRASNEARADAGYETVDLVGWAARPVYDPKSHSVVWAKDLAFSGSPDLHTLNYDLRTLGRHGVLSMNLVSTMPQIGSVRVAANELAQHAGFQAGARYEDYNAATDKTAEYGIAGLIAAGAGATAAKKLGLFAILAKFLKPLLIGLVAFFGVFWKKITRFFGMSSEEDYEDAEWQESYAAEEDEGLYGDDAPTQDPAGESDLPGEDPDRVKSG